MFKKPIFCIAASVQIQYRSNCRRIVFMKIFYIFDKKKLKKIFRQPWTRYFWTFLPFGTISLYQQGYETKLLSPEIEYRSFLTSC